MATKTGNSLDNWLRGTADNDTLNGLGGNDVLWGLGGDDILSGGNDRDVLIGGPGDDGLYGMAGNDVLIGGEGDGDYFYGGAGADVMLGSGGWRVTALYNFSPAGVTVNLATGRGQGGDAEGDVLIGIPGVYGSDYGDTLTGDEQDNHFWGGGGGDVLEGRGGADTLDGGGGYLDYASYAHSPGGVTVDLTLTGPQATENNHDAAGDTLIGIENLEGSNYADTLRGDENANKLQGGGGDDVLEGRGGADTLDGGLGDDVASYAHSPGGVTVNLALTGPQASENNHDAAGDTLIGIYNLEGSAHSDRLTGDDGYNVLEGRGGADTLDGGLGSHDTASYAHSPGGVTVDLTLTGPQATENNHDAAGDTLIGIEHLEGSDHSDRLTGDNWRNNELEGRGGADVLDGGRGVSDVASYRHSPGGVTVDLTLTGPQATENNHDAAGDTLIGIEYLRGSNYSDRLTGDNGANRLFGEDGNDNLYGGEGNDSLRGGEGNDNLYGGDGNDNLSGWDGNDHLYGGDAHDYLSGGDGNDSLYGWDGNDSLRGGDGNDTLDGGIGNDWLYGNAGIDTLYGGTGEDRFVFTSGSVVDTGNAEETRTLADETDTVTDFSGQEGDSLDLRHLKHHSLFTGGTTPGTELSLLRDEGAAFTGVKGQVKWWWDDQPGTDNDVTHVQVDLDGDGNANFQVDLTGLHSLVVADFVLA